VRPMESAAADQTAFARKLPSLALPDGIALSRGAGTSPMIVQTKSPSHREDISLVRDSSIPTRNGESTISSVVAESPASGHFARGQSRPCSHSAYWAARRAGDSELAASSLPLRAPRRQSALGGGRRAGAEAAAAAWAGPGGLGAASPLLRECRAGHVPGRACRAHARRAIVMQARAAVCGKPELGHGPGHRPLKLAGATGRAQRSAPGDARPTVSCTAARQANQ
jgi:hypothetical protein